MSSTWTQRQLENSLTSTNLEFKEAGQENPVTFTFNPFPEDIREYCNHKECCKAEVWSACENVE